MNNITLSILEENEFFIVINKPSGLSVHNHAQSLETLLKEKKYPTHFVNRLDEQTSGLIIVALHSRLHLPLSESLQRGHKTYRALLRSSWKAPTQNILWNAPLSDKAEGRKNPQGLKHDQKPCLTQVTHVRSNKYFTEVTCEIKTGRQHQIRKHASLAKQPIVGDTRYNDPDYNAKIQKIYNLHRMLLHAESLVFEFNKTPYNFNVLDLKLDEFF